MPVCQHERHQGAPKTPGGHRLRTAPRESRLTGDHVKLIALGNPYVPVVMPGITM
jgi:hypothetical protein